MFEEEEIEQRNRQLPKEELKLYTDIADTQTHQLLIGVLQGHTLNKMTKNDMNSILDYMVDMNLGYLPDSHLHYFIKWVGTGVARKFATRRCQSITLRLFSELSQRPVIRNMLLMSKKEKSNRLFSGQEQIKVCSYKEMKTQLQPGQLELAYKTMFSSEEALYMYFDILVSFSNLNIYMPEYFESVKLLLSHAVLADPENADVHSMVYFKITNIVWAITKVAQTQDLDFNATMLSFYSDAIISTNSINRQLNLLWILSIDYLLSTGQPSARLLQTIQSALTSYAENSWNRDNMNYNSKYSYLICQIVLSLYPEIGPHLRNNSLSQVTILPNNPFRSHYKQLEELMLPSLWIIQENMKCKQGQSGLSLTYLESVERNTLVSKPSIYTDATHSLEKKVASALQNIEGVRSIRMNVMIGFYEIDILVNDHIAISCDSAYHFVYGRKDKLNVSMNIKQKHLEHLGIHEHISLDYDTINDVRSSILEFLKNKLTKSLL